VPKSVQTLIGVDRQEQLQAFTYLSQRKAVRASRVTDGFDESLSTKPSMQVQTHSTCSDGLATDFAIDLRQGPVIVMA
jgi:hypothetical protein